MCRFIACLVSTASPIVFKFAGNCRHLFRTGRPFRRQWIDKFRGLESGNVPRQTLRKNWGRREESRSNLDPSYRSERKIISKLWQNIYTLICSIFFFPFVWSKSFRLIDNYDFIIISSGKIGKIWMISFRKRARISRITFIHVKINPRLKIRIPKKWKRKREEKGRENKKKKKGVRWRVVEARFSSL